MTAGVAFPKQPITNIGANNSMTRQNDLVEVVKSVFSSIPGREEEKSRLLARLEDNAPKAQEKEPRFVTLPKAAEILQSSPQSVRRWILSGHLRNYGKGRRYLLSLDEIASVSGN